MTGICSASDRYSAIVLLPDAGMPVTKIPYIALPLYTTAISTFTFRFSAWRTKSSETWSSVIRRS